MASAEGTTVVKAKVARTAYMVGQGVSRPDVAVEHPAPMLLVVPAAVKARPPAEILPPLSSPTISPRTIL